MKRGVTLRKAGAPSLANTGVYLCAELVFMHRARGVHNQFTIESGTQSDSTKRSAVPLAFLAPGHHALQIFTLPHVNHLRFIIHFQILVNFYAQQYTYNNHTKSASARLLPAVVFDRM